MRTSLTEKEANAVYNVLVEECGALERERERFVNIQTRGCVPEWRFQGALGFGGKFYQNIDRWYVSCYAEDETPSRMESIRRANKRLARIHRDCKNIRV